MKYSNLTKLPDHIADVLKIDEYDYTDALSITELIDPPKLTILKRRHREDMTIDVTDGIWAFMGNAIHHEFERKTKGGLTEERLYGEIDGTKISGKPDYVGEGVIRDYKCTSVWNYVFGKTEWHTQLNAYKWLLNKTKGSKVGKLEIVGMWRDWVKSKAGDATYPETAISVMNIPIWEDPHIEEYLKQRVALYKKYWEAPDNEIPECSHLERWGKPATFAIMKGTNKTAHKVFHNIEEAKKYLSDVQYGSNIKWTLIERQGASNKRCEEYCSVGKNGFCNYYNKVVRKD